MIGTDLAAGTRKWNPIKSARECLRLNRLTPESVYMHQSKALVLIRPRQGLSFFRYQRPDSALNVRWSRATWQHGAYYSPLCFSSCDAHMRRPVRHTLILRRFVSCIFLKGLTSSSHPAPRFRISQTMPLSFLRLPICSHHHAGSMLSNGYVSKPFGSAHQMLFPFLSAHQHGRVITQSA